MGYKISVCGIALFFGFLSISCTNADVITAVNKMIIDTDAGGDDAIALSMAVENEKWNGCTKIIGITCVNGNAYVDTVALNVLKTLKVLDRLDIPVYKGASHPLLLPDVKDHYFGQDGFGDFYYPDPPSTDLINQKDAVSAMIELVKQHPGEVTILALGPLTNIALAIRIYPKFLEKLQQLIVMGGSTEGRGNAQPGMEFNFVADPVANFIVFNSSTPRLTTLISLETTKRAGVPMTLRNSLFKSNNRKTWLIESATALTLKPSDEFSYWSDSVAASVALTSGSIVTKSNTFFSEAIYDGTKTAGMIIVDYTNITKHTPNTYLVQEVNESIYLDLLSKYLS
ncbi:probable uridine nucleosidase 2 [Neodiprion fabricii]|uniref:probable uridine nucleosidase 2 n=1 Tax=Neodiprion fabricii TaxID=2872261 RepID=UPI001ED938CE|nr:probable uridine nucleosidase 2 [Neodiprion fabricii]